MLSMIALYLSLFLIVCVLIVVLRLILYKTALIYNLKEGVHWIEDRVHVHQFFKVPEFNENDQENQFYRKVFDYVNSLSSMEDSDFTNLFSGKKSNDILLSLDDNQTVHDSFLGARVSWTITNVIVHENKENEKVAVVADRKRSSFSRRRTFVLKIKKKDKRRILLPYLQHIHAVSDDIELRRKEVRLYMNTESHRGMSGGRWRSVPFTHPATLDTIAMDADLKNKVRSDLEAFTKSKQYYHRLGRVWRRSYLLYGPSGTGKSSFVAAMAKFFGYDVYDVDLSRVSDDSDLKLLLLQTRSRSLIVIEDLDRFVAERERSTAASTAERVSLSGVLNFMDGIVNSCSGDEKVMVFTMSSKDQIDPAMLRPGRIDVHIHFPLCDFNNFKTLAQSYLGVKEHKLFPQVEELFQSGGASMSPAEIGELMIVNRSSPSRALKSVITALQTSAADSRGAAGKSAKPPLAPPTPSSSAEESGELGGAFYKDSMPVKEIRKLYGLLRMKSSSKRVGPSDHRESEATEG